MQYLPELPNGMESAVRDFPRSVEDLFNRFWGGVAPARVRNAWLPPVDVIETPEAYVLRAEIPGVDPDDIEVTLAGDTLTIRGQKALEEKLEDESWRLNERLAGRFERSFTLPAPVAAEAIEAESRHGVLTVRLTKAKEAQPHRVQVRKS